MTLTLDRDRTGVAVPAAAGGAVATTGAQFNQQTTAVPLLVLFSQVDQQNEWATNLTRLPELCGIGYVLIWDEMRRRFAERIEFCLDERWVWADVSVLVPASSAEGPATTPPGADRPSVTRLGNPFDAWRESECHASTPRASVPAGTTANRDSERELTGDLSHLRKLLERGSVEEARAFVRALARRWPDSERVRHFARVLAPPVASRRPDLRSRPLDRERAWLRENAHAYPGCWLAVLEDRLIAADPNLRVVLARLRETPGGEHALLHLQPGSAD